MKTVTFKIQNIPAQKIKVVGFTQFDFYVDKKIIKDRKLYCTEKKFDENLPILFFGSEGDWSVGDTTIIDDVLKARDNEEIANVNILIRPHFSHLSRHPYNKYKNTPNVYVDDTYRASSFFHDGWDPSRNDMLDFTNSLYHSALLITFASTLALDAACFHKPTLAVKYGVRFINGKDRSDLLYKTDHYAWVLKTKGVTIVNNKKELVYSINKYIDNPLYKSSDRERLRVDLCDRVDGNSSKRIMDIILATIK